MLIEMHCHTAEHSPCSVIPAVELVRRIAGLGLQGMVLTDHHHLWPEESVAELVRTAGVPSYFTVMAAQEVTTEVGDVLVYGARRAFSSGTKLEELRRLAPEAALVLAHPYRNGKIPSPERLGHPALDAVEIFNSNHTAGENRRALTDWHRYRFTAVSGTDTHAAEYAGLYPTLFDHPLHDAGELAREIRSGRCRPYLREVPLYGENTSVTEVVIGTAGTEPPEAFIVRTAERDEKWAAADRAYRIAEGLRSAGFPTRRYRMPDPVEADAEARTVVERKLDGETLHRFLRTAPPAEGAEALREAAGWLARLHSLGLRITPPAEYLPKEERRIARYVEYFEAARHPMTGKARDLADILWEEIRAGFVDEREFVQGHGDFHPKNVFIGRDRTDAVLFAAAIDFDSSYCQPRPFDVGYFLAQFRHQFFGDERLLRLFPERLFVEAYVEASGGVPQRFFRDIALFRARTCLNIASFLVKIGQGESPDLRRVLNDAEKGVTLYLSSYRNSRGRGDAPDRG
jgi:3',5'-nucleoside bisphosphate phosphatase